MHIFYIIKAKFKKWTAYAPVAQAVFYGGLVNITEKYDARMVLQKQKKVILWKNVST
jgi:hypothetical protein